MSIKEVFNFLQSFSPFLTGSEIPYGFIVRPGGVGGVDGQMYGTMGNFEFPILHQGPQVHAGANHLLVQPALAAQAPFLGYRSPRSSLNTTRSLPMPSSEVQVRYAHEPYFYC